eukprot:g66346.t1
MVENTVEDFKKMQDPNEPYDWRKSDKFQTWCPNCMAQGVAVPQKSGRTFFECEPCSAAWAADDPEMWDFIPRRA